MRILLLNVLYSPYAEGGAEVVVRELAAGLAGRGHEVQVLTTAPDGHAHSGAVDGVRVDYVRVRNLFRPYSGPRRSSLLHAAWHAIDSRNPLMARLVARHLRQWRPDVLHSHNLVGFSTAAWRAAAREGVAVVHTLHEYHVLCPASNLCRGGQPCAPQRCGRCRLYGLPRRAASRHVDQVIGVSRHILDRHLREGCFPQAAHGVIPNTCRSPDDRTLPARASPGARRIGFLGRLVREKGVESLLRAWLRLPVRAGIELHIAGTGTADYLAKLRALAGDRPDVHWRGFVAADAFLDDIDLLVVPSLWEDPAPLVVQEALARRVPVLGAARGGIPELLGDPTMQFEPLDPDELADRLAALIDGPLPAPQTDLAQWSPASVLDRTEAAYRAAIARRRAATGH